jgi:hypothetical protein
MVSGLHSRIFGTKSPIGIIQTINIIQTIVAKIAVITTTAGEMRNFVVFSIFRFTLDTFVRYNKDTGLSVRLEVVYLSHYISKQIKSFINLFEGDFLC